MKSGSEIEGAAVSENSVLITVDIGYGKVNLQKTDILKIRRATKAQREAAGKQQRRNKFRSGALVPKGAEKLAGLFRTVSSAGDKAAAARSRRAARLAELKAAQGELSSLTKRYQAASNELAGIDAESEPSEYTRAVGELNKIGNQIRAKELGREEARRQADKPDSSFQVYLDAYRALDGYLQGEGKPLMEAPRKGPDEEYFAWLRGEVARMKRDFRMDAIESEGREGHLIVKVLLDGRVSARLMVDTGATTTVLYSNVADALKLGPKDMVRSARVVMGDGRSIETQVINLESLAVGKSVVKNSLASILPSTSDGGIDGLLGMSFLSHFVVRVDSANGKLILESLK